MSPTGPGSDQSHLLALLRAIRLRHGAEEAAAAGASDTEAALTAGLTGPHPADSPPNGLARHDQARPHWPSAPSAPIPPAAPDHAALPPGHSAAALPPVPPVDPAEQTTSAGGPAADDPAPGRALPPTHLPPAHHLPTASGASRLPATGVPAPGIPAIGRIPGPHGPGYGAPRTGTPTPGDPAGPPGGVPPLRPPTSHAPGAGAALPVDGMDPADDVALHDIQRLLRASLDLAGGPAEVGMRLRTALVQARPDLLAALPGGPDTHTDQLAAALTWLVDNMDSPPAMVEGCGRLGAALAECGVRPQQLQLVGAALAEAMRAGIPAGGWRQDYDEAWRTTWQHAYAWISHGETLAAYRPTVWTAVVVEHERRRDDLAVLRLRPFLPMPFRPGQYARIEVPELPGVWRPYSLAGVPRRDNLIELHVRAKTHDGVSGALVYRTAVGDTVRIGRPEGAMGVPNGSGRGLLMIAGDTGVVPLKAMLAELAETGDPRPAVLFWGVRNLDELYDIEALAAIARAARRATVVPVISEGECGPYASGLVTDAVAAYGEWSGHEVFLAGPPLMLAATSIALHALGVRPERIHHDAPEG